MRGEIEEVLTRIEELRKILNELVGMKGSLLDPEVLEANRKLEAVLTDYYRLVRAKAL